MKDRYWYKWHRYDVDISPRSHPFGRFSGWYPITTKPALGDFLYLHLLLLSGKILQLKTGYPSQKQMSEIWYLTFKTFIQCLSSLYLSESPMFVLETMSALMSYDSQEKQRKDCLLYLHKIELDFNILSDFDN